MAEVNFPAGLPANSDNVINKDTTKEPAPERVQVASHSNKVQKKSSKIGNTIKKEGSEVGKYILNDVVKPTILDSLYDLGSGALGMLIYKDPNAFRRAKFSRTRGVLGSVISHTDYAGLGRPRKRDPFTGPTAINYSKPVVSVGGDVLSDVNIFDSYDDAYLVRQYLLDICLNEHRCSVADFFKAVGEEPDHTFLDWGWTSLDSSYITRSGDIYRIELPRPRQLR